MSEFTSQGAEREYPQLHIDRQRMHEVAEFSDERLLENIQKYVEFIKDEDTFEPHREKAEDILNHLIFERAYRAGLFDEYIGGDDD